MSRFDRLVLEQILVCLQQDLEEIFGRVCDMSRTMKEQTNQNAELNLARRLDVRSSSYVPQGPVVHSRSNLGQLGFGVQNQSSQDVVLSSAWLWNQPSFDVRISVSFPEEWIELQKHRSQRLDQYQDKFDFWIFRNLSENEIHQLEKLLDESPGTRAIVAFHHLLDSEMLFKNLNWQKWKQRQQIFLSFLPPTHELDPMLSPQEVLSFLNRSEIGLPLVAYQFQIPKTSDFYQTFDPLDYSQEMNSKNPFLTKFLTTTDRRGYHLVLLALESLLAFVSQGDRARLNDFFHHLTQQLILLIPKKIRSSLKKIYWSVRYQFQKRFGKNHEV